VLHCIERAVVQMFNMRSHHTLLQAIEYLSLLYRSPPPSLISSPSPSPSLLLFFLRIPSHTFLHRPVFLYTHHRQTIDYLCREGFKKNDSKAFELYVRYGPCLLLLCGMLSQSLSLIPPLMSALSLSLSLSLTLSLSLSHSLSLSLSHSLSLSLSHSLALSLSLSPSLSLSLTLSLPPSHSLSTSLPSSVLSVAHRLIPYTVTPYHFLRCAVTSYLIPSYSVTSSLPSLSHHAISYPAFSHPILSHLILQLYVISYHISLHGNILHHISSFCAGTSPLPRVSTPSVSCSGIGRIKRSCGSK
jgi:hypothetical protein